MSLSRVNFKVLPCHCAGIYQKERDSLSEKQIDEILLSGRKWDLTSTLRAGGAVAFPHTYLALCGSHIAAAVHAALDTGSDHVLLLGVLHSFKEKLAEARMSERTGIDVSKHALRGVHGPDLPFGSHWKDEYSLLSFIFLWNEEIKRRGIKAPKLTQRYPYLVNQHPESLPGIQELQAIAKDAVVVATSDFCHHGLAYGTPKTKCLVGEEAIEYAKNSLTKQFDILKTNDLAAFYQQAFDVRSDSFDVSPVIRHLCGPCTGSILDLAIVDTTPLYEGNLSPSWVAASLVQFTK
jgi:hypothetical protein